MDLLEAKKILNKNDYYLVEKSQYDGIEDSTPKVKELINTLKSSGLADNLEMATKLEEKLVGMTESNMNRIQKVKKFKSEWETKEKTLKGSLDDSAKFFAKALNADKTLFFKVLGHEQKAGILLEKVVKVASQDDVYALIERVMHSPDSVETSKELAVQMASSFKKLLNNFYQRALDAGWISIGDKSTTWRASYYDQDEKGNMKKFIGKKEMAKDRAEWTDKSIKARKLKKESYEMNEGFFGDMVSKLKSFASWLIKSIFGEFSDTRSDVRVALNAYDKILVQIIDGCEGIFEVEQ